MAPYTLFPRSVVGRCDICKQSKFKARAFSLWACRSCSSLICDSCWVATCPAHLEGNVGSTGIQHEKVEPAVLELLMDVLRPDLDGDEVDLMHEKDEESIWFGKPDLTLPCH